MGSWGGSRVRGPQGVGGVQQGLDLVADGLPGSALVGTQHARAGPPFELADFHWSSLEMVLRYAHLGGDHLKEAANRIHVTSTSQWRGERKLTLVVT